VVIGDAPDGASQGEFLYDQHPLAIEYMREQDYPGSELVVEQTLSSGSNYSKYVVSYKSEGLKQFALLAVPNGQAPESGWPGIVFNHGYVSPSVYRTTERYGAYVDGFARSGYVVLKPDYRGHGNSEGRAEGGYGSPAYTIDVLNAFASLHKYPGVDASRIGMWGHSMGGHITLRAMVIDPDIKTGVIWGGVVGSYQDYDQFWWGRRRRPTPTASPRPGDRGYWRQSLYQQYGTFDENPEFWNSISATTFLDDLSGPIQLHHAEGDASVPYELAENIYNLMKSKGLGVEWHLYPGDDHNISANFWTAMRRSVEWFDRYVKGDQ
jgi:dipeptidyl aminopeptidase/acylaminoacyl peptidase